MPKSKNRTGLKNIARGRVPYRQARHKIANQILSLHEKYSDNLNPFLETELFKLQKNKWVALAFDSRDWRTLGQIRDRCDEAYDISYLRLLTRYIIANAPRVAALYDRHTAISSAVINDDGSSIAVELDQFDADDQQSLFTFRIVCALHSHSSEQLTDYFKRNFKTEWLRQRFLYPLIYHAINCPADTYLDIFLSYVITGEEVDSERATMRFLLRDDICYDDPLAFKAYVALLCHPYDACEILLDHVEIEFAKSGFVDSQVREALDAIRAVIPNARVAAMSDMVNRKHVPRVAIPTGPALTERYKFAPQIARFILEFMQTAPSYEKSPTNLSRPLAALDRMRSSPYPSVKDFDYLVPSAQKWRFTEAGRLLNALLNSLYLLNRRESICEIRELLRLRMFIGEICPFIAASPSGIPALRLDLNNTDEEVEFETLCDLNISDSAKYKDRMWIKSVQWNLRRPEQNMRVTEWLATVRQDIRIAPSFLTGIDWSWIDNIIKVVRLQPFAGNADGIYALLLMQIEEPDRDPTVLRTAIEPIIGGCSPQEVIQWLIDEFNEEATAFVRYFLTPEIILLLRVTPNETAALAARVFALEACVKKFGFSNLLSFELFEQE